MRSQYAAKTTRKVANPGLDANDRFLGEAWRHPFHQPMIESVPSRPGGRPASLPAQP